MTSAGRQMSEAGIGEVARTVRALNVAARKQRALELEDVDDENGAGDWTENLLAVLGRMSAQAFERLCQRVLREAGFTKVEVTGKSGDGGIDGIGVLRVRLVSFQALFQCKRWKGSVGSSVVRDFRGAMVGRADKGLIITTGDLHGGCASRGDARWRPGDRPCRRGRSLQAVEGPQDRRRGPVRRRGRNQRACLCRNLKPTSRLPAAHLEFQQRPRPFPVQGLDVLVVAGLEDRRLGGGQRRIARSAPGLPAPWRRSPRHAVARSRSAWRGRVSLPRRPLPPTGSSSGRGGGNTGRGPGSQPQKAEMISRQWSA